MRIDARTAAAPPPDWLQAICHEALATPKPQEAELQRLESKKLSPQQEFFKKYAGYAVHTQRLTGIPASVTLAQAALESGWGKHAPGNNFFGIKGNGPAGTQRLWTREFQGGKMRRVRAPFRRYETPLQSFVDHAQVIAKGRYLKHAMEHTQSAGAFIAALQSGKRKYATDPRYEEKIMAIIRRHQLERLDLGVGS